MSTAAIFFDLGVRRMASATGYHIEGSYYEACNCQAICPCRQQNGVAGGLSTYGICDFLLSWHIKKGDAGGIDLSGLGVGLAGRYSDDEEDTPWSVIIYIDESATDDQYKALSDMFQGNAKGNMAFTGYISKVLGIRRASIKLDHTAGREAIQIGNIASANAVSIVDSDGPVSCGIPGHDHPGQESVSSLSCSDDELQWDYKERCGFATDFAYWS